MCGQNLFDAAFAVGPGACCETLVVVHKALMDCLGPLFLLADKLLCALPVACFESFHPDMYSAALRAPLRAAAHIVHHLPAVNTDAGVDHIVVDCHVQPAFLPLFTVFWG